MFYIYFAKSLKNDKIYVGSTNKDPKDRVNEHNLGKNIWARANGPFKLLYYESYCCKRDSRLRELFFKTGFGKRIKSLIVKEMAG